MVAHMVVLGPEFDLLPDDTEEALLGSMIHQGVIVSSVNSLGRVNRRERRGWAIGNQLKLIIPRQPGQRPYSPSPDIIVHTSPLISAQQGSLNINVYGPPALAMEICSPSTALEHDLDTFNPDAKPRAYARAGIPEYLVFDPTGDLIPELIRAWRLGPPDSYVPWLPDPVTGRWHSALGISFAPEGVRLRVYDSAGNVVPDNDEMDDLLEAQRLEYEARIAALEAELRRQRGE
jgi:Uma2 family endonuclease